MLTLAILIFLVLSLVFAAGMLVGNWMGRTRYNGVIVCSESAEGLKFSIELAGDPELLADQESVTFKVIPVDYDKLLSR